MPKKLWFKRKCYGWGWRPVSYEGWFVTLLFIIGLLYIGFYHAPTSSEEVWSFLLLVTFLAILLIVIAYKTGEKPKWQWGKK